MHIIDVGAEYWRRSVDDALIGDRFGHLWCRVIDDTGITDHRKGHLHLNSVAKLEVCHQRRFDPKILPSPYKYDSLVWFTTCAKFSLFVL